MKKRSRRWLQGGLSILALVLAVGLVFYLVTSRKKPQQAQGGPKGTLVQTERLEVTQTTLPLRAQGTVRPAREVELRAEVGGRVTEVSPNLQPGRRIQEGEVIVRIDPEEYRLRVAEAQAALVQAKADLALEKGRREVAEEEWELFKQRVENERLLGDRSLALREPQLAAAAAQVQQAQTQLARAQLNLDRSTVTAPFDAIVSSEQSEVGQVLSAQTAIATLVGTDVYWVQAAVPAAQVEQIAFPAPGQEGGGSKATIRFDTGDSVLDYSARVAQLLPAVDPQGRMARVLLTVEEPFQGLSPEETRQRLPLLIDSYVDVVIQTTLQGAYVRIPRNVLQGNDELYIYQDGQLHIATPEILWRGEEAVWTADQSLGGARVITSPIAAAVEGMQLRLAEEVQQQNESQSQTQSDDQKSTAGDNEYQQEQSGQSGGGGPSWLIWLGVLLLLGGVALAAFSWWRHKRSDGDDTPSVDLVTVGKPLVLDPNASPLFSLPTAAVHEDSVLLYENGQVRRRRVSVASTRDGRALVSEGVAEGMQLVCPNTGELDDGDRANPNDGAHD